LKKFFKKIEKPLDKPHGMWYNISTKGEPINPIKKRRKGKTV
jgi:hypothetical protein